MIQSKEINDLLQEWGRGEADADYIIHRLFDIAAVAIDDRDKAIAEYKRRGLILDSISAVVENKRIHIEQNVGKWNGLSDVYFLKAINWIGKEINLRWTPVSEEIMERWRARMYAKIEALKNSRGS